MLRKLSELQGIAVEATDGKVGSLSDLYLDGGSWRVRRLGVSTGNGTPGRLILLPTDAILRVYLNDLLENAAVMSLTRQQLPDYPYTEADPVTGRHRTVVVIVDQVGRAARLPADGTRWSPVATAAERAKKETLLSAIALSRYDIAAQDGELGHAKDLLIDDRTWEVHYLVVDTRKWWPGKRVLIGVRDVGRTDNAHAKIYVKMVQDAIRTAREYNPNVVLNG